MLARNIERDLEALSGTPLAEAREEWRKTFRTAAPGRMSRKLMVRALAYEKQARTLGRLKPKVIKQLRQIVLAESSLPDKTAVPSLLPGTRLLRDWNGVCHRVDVTEDGFHWDSRTWSSLSAIAREITGTRWNGPLFFGLRTRRGKQEGKNEAKTT